MKKHIAIFVTLVLVLLCTAACNILPDNKFKEYNLMEIEYQNSKLIKGNASSNIILTVPGGKVSTGQSVSVNTKIASGKAFPIGKEAVYYIVDWGDGTWSYKGPGIHNSDKQTYISLSHVYKKAGEYSVSATAVSMQGGADLGWSYHKKITVEGEDITYDGLITKLKPISSRAYSKDFEVDNITKSNLSYFKSAASTDVYEELYSGYLFNDIYTLDKVEIKIPEQSDIFPSNIAIEYTVDGGKSWHSLPKYYYLYDYSKGRFSPIMNFPNPQGATLVLDLDGIVANGLRLVSKLSSMKISDINKEKYLAVESMRVYGSNRTLLYTSYGSDYDASLNNMWTIYGTAKTEPVVLGSIAGEMTNQSPFRAGAAMIASTEWLEWTGNKLNFLSYDDFKNVKDAYYEQLKQVKVGNDGWSDDDGYVWATADAPEHLTLGNHYSLNPIFIIAAKNYLLQGNAVGEYDDQGNFIKFLDIENRSGQKMSDRIDKAMDYMINTLDGKNGIMTIFDPRHDGTVNGFASNYWDVHRSFGYKSAYENALFYGSLLAYADIKEFTGDLSAATQYRQYAENTKELYNMLFWDSQKGRYIAAVNIDGVRLDFGITFVNFMACSYGLADADKAKAVYDWMDGERIIESDTSKGEDIYGNFKYAARSNTLDVSSTGEPYFWYDHNGALPPTPGTFGGFGNQMQNGGTIFYISHYDMMGRVNNINPDNANKRFDIIMNEFKKDQLRRNSYTQHGEYVEGILGEFPESGLVPYTFISGFLGINVSAEGLKISPNLPSDMKYAGISSYYFGNREYSIKIRKDLSAPVIEKYGNLYYLQLPADKTFVITLDNRLIEK